MDDPLSEEENPFDSTFDPFTAAQQRIGSLASTFHPMRQTKKKTEENRGPNLTSHLLLQADPVISLNNEMWGEASYDVWQCH